MNGESVEGIEGMVLKVFACCSTTNSMATKKPETLKIYSWHGA